MSPQQRIPNLTTPLLSSTSHMQGPLTITESGKPLTKEDLDEVKAELEAIKHEYGWKEPDQSFMDYLDIKWLLGGKFKWKKTFIQVYSPIKCP